MKVLIIEDEHKVASLVKRGLEQEGHDVAVAYDITEGQQAALHSKLDIVIVARDIGGKAKGLQIVNAMRDHKNHTPALLLTNQAAASKNQDSSVDDYLAKPFSMNELLEKLRNLTQTSDAHTPLTYKDIVLDPATFTVTRAKKPIELTGREFTLLEYLMRNPGRVLTKDMITAYVWDYSTDILPNTIEVYIGYLRNKLEKPFGNESLMRTRRGFGYIFGEA